MVGTAQAESAGSCDLQWEVVGLSPRYVAGERLGCIRIGSGGTKLALSIWRSATLHNHTASTCLP